VLCRYCFLHGGYFAFVVIDLPLADALLSSVLGHSLYGCFATVDVFASSPMDAWPSMESLADAYRHWLVSPLSGIFCRERVGFFLVDTWPSWSSLAEALPLLLLDARLSSLVGYFATRALSNL
jgi:hypothetical protein